jgi:hypothetical protein
MKRRCSDARPAVLGEIRHLVAAAWPCRLWSGRGRTFRRRRFEPKAQAGTATCYSEDLRGPGHGTHLTGRWSGPATTVAAFDELNEPAAHLQR